uniref:RanBD1 domain-containing protein n=1 Tax=Rhabditophanes sp. KR3021 TaxID=114890 RepID=A0AC35TIU8_9BILA
MTEFHQKISVLNKCLVEFLADAYEKAPTADLTPCLDDYRKHLAKIDDTFCAHPKTNDDKALFGNAPTSQATKGSIFGVATPKESTTSGKRPELQTNDSDRGLLFKDLPSTTNSYDSKSISSIFGNSMAGAPLEVKTIAVEPSSFKLPSFSNFKDVVIPPREVDSTGENSFGGGKILKRGGDSIFGDGKRSRISSNKDDKDDVRPIVPASVFGDAMKASGKSIFGNNTMTTPASGSIFGSAASKISEFNRDSSAKPSNSLSENLFSGIQKQATSDSEKPNIFSTSTFKLPDFTFNKPPATEAAKPENDEDAEEDEPKEKYDPLQADKDALYSVKARLHQLVNNKYEKKGEGYINIKKDDDKKLCLVRAANAIGSVMINVFVNDSFKFAKAADKKFRFTFPVKAEDGDKVNMETWLCTVSAASECDDCEKHLKP